MKEDNNEVCVKTYFPGPLSSTCWVSVGSMKRAMDSSQWIQLQSPAVSVSMCLRKCDMCKEKKWWFEWMYVMSVHSSVVYPWGSSWVLVVAWMPCMPPWNTLVNATGLKQRKNKQQHISELLKVGSDERHTSFAYLSHLNKWSKFWPEPNTIKVSSEGFLEADWQYRLIDS